MSTPIGVVINGLSGFAWVHHRAVLAAESKGLCRLLGYCDHQPGEAGEKVRQQFRLRERGVELFSDFPSMLDRLGSRCAMAFIPSPPAIHAEDHRTAISRGVRCYLEKPPSLAPAEFEAMVALERRTNVSAIVGFNQMADPVRFALKRRLIAGDFGRLQQIQVMGFWPRPASYYARARWPGRLTVNGQLILDSVFGNAMGHFLHGMLFWGATENVWSWTSVQSIEAELYRANAIESADTVFARGVLRTGVPFRIAFSHACEDTIDPIERLECSDAVISLDRGSATIAWRTGDVESLPAGPDDSHDRSITRAIAEVRGEAVTMPSVSLTHCASFVDLNALLYVAAMRIHDVDSTNIRSTHIGVTIIGVEDAARALLAGGKLPTEALIPWARAGGAATCTDIGQLDQTIASMSAATANKVQRVTL